MGERIGIDGAALSLYVQGVLTTLVFGLIGGIYVIAPILMVLTVPSGSANGGDVIGMVMSAVCGLAFVVGLWLLFGLPYFVIGWGLRTRKSWSHIAGLIMAALSLQNCPFGLIGGIVVFLALTNSVVIAELRAGPVDTGEGWNE